MVFIPARLRGSALMAAHVQLHIRIVTKPHRKVRTYPRIAEGAAPYFVPGTFTTLIVNASISIRAGYEMTCDILLGRHVGVYTQQPQPEPTAAAKPRPLLPVCNPRVPAGNAAPHTSPRRSPSLSCSAPPLRLGTSTSPPHRPSPRLEIHSTPQP